MGLKEVKYDAFISYRHSELDKSTAIAIQKRLENFKLPKSLLKKTKTGKTCIERVFRDQDELPLVANLSEPIEEALQNADNLIVICTPRLPQSAWCAKEIETFISMHGREHIYVVLAEGEPEDSFPKQLLSKTCTVTDSDGNTHEETVMLEPLAADVRGSSKKEVRKMLDDAAIRLAAPIFGLNYDDLKQRHKEQQTRRILTVAGIAASVFFLFGLICMGMLVRISSQKNTISRQYSEIEQKNVEIQENNEVISRQNDDLKEKIYAERIRYSRSMARASSELLKDCYQMDAIYAARHAMPDTKSVEASEDELTVPYTAEAEAALADALGIYDEGSVLSPRITYPLAQSAQSIIVSEEEQRLLVTDMSNRLYCFDIATGETLLVRPHMNEVVKPFCPSRDTLVYSVSGVVYCHNLVTKEERKLSKDTQRKAVLSHSGDVLYAVEFSWKEGFLLRSYLVNEDFRMSAEYILPLEKDFNLTCIQLTIDENDSQILLVLNRAMEENANAGYQILSFDTETMEQKYSINLPFSYVEDVVTDRAVYVLTRAKDQTSNEYVSCVYAYDLSDGKELWNRRFEKLFTQLSYVEMNGRELVLDGEGILQRLDADSGKDLSTGLYTGTVVNSYFVAAGESYCRFMFLDNGEIDFFLPDSNQIYVATQSYLKHAKDKKVTAFQNGETAWYFSYLDENTVSQYALKDKTYEEEVPVATRIHYNGVGYEYSGDFQYELHTVEDGQKDGKKQYRHVLTRTADNTVLCSVTDTQKSAGFLGMNPTKFITYGNGLIRYSFDGNEEQSFVSEKIVTYQFSEDLTYMLIYSSGELTCISLENFEKKDVIRIATTQFCASGTGKILVAVGEKSIDCYRLGEDEPFAKRQFDEVFEGKVILSTDGRYLYIYKPDHTLEIYATNDLEKPVRISYGLEYQIDKVIYYESIHAYMMTSIAFENYLLNEAQETLRVLYRYITYDEKTNSFIEVSGNSLMRVPYLSYEEIIRIADEQLPKGYVPSGQILDKYSINPDAFENER